MKSSILFIVGLWVTSVKAQVDPLPHDCGRRITSLPKIIGGRLAVEGEYPWQVHIRTSEFTCGATIIHPEWLLTAAHCIPNQSGNPIHQGISACVGTIDKDNCGKTIQSAKIIPHYGFEFDRFPPRPNDIALVKLSEVLEFNEKTSASSGPEINSDIEIAGWGDVGNGTTSHLLKMAHMNLQSPATCIDDPSFHIICLKTDYNTEQPAGHPCFGDSGGYGGIEENGKSVQYGITSFGPVGGPEGCLEPDSYTDVAYYSDWIREEIRGN